MTKRKAPPPEPEYDLPNNSIGCMRSFLFAAMVLTGVALFIWFLILIQ